MKGCSNKRISQKCINAIDDIQKSILGDINIILTYTQASDVLADIYFDPDRPLTHYKKISVLSSHPKKMRLSHNGRHI